MAEPTTAQTKKAARKPKAHRAAEPEQAKTKLARSAYLQTKMDVSTPGDKHEQEADRVAEEVSRMPKGVARSAEEHSVPPGSSTPTSNVGNEQSLQTKISRLNRAESEAEAATKLARNEDKNVSPIRRQEDEAQTKLNRADDESLATKISRSDTEDEAQTKLHRAEDEQLATKISRAETEDATNQTETGNEAEPQTPVVTDDIEQKINALKGQGQALPDDVKADMESKFNADFSDVSIHTSGEADALCKQLSARAFAVGNDLFFATGEYAPETDAGRKLLAHELTHVVQQSGGVGRKVFRNNGTGGTNSTGTGTPSRDQFDIVHHGITIGVDVSNPSEVRYTKLPLPPFKVPLHPGQLKRRTGTRTADQNRQREAWANSAGNSAAIKSFISDAIQAAYNQTPNNSQTYVFSQNPAGYYRATRRIFGTQPVIAKDLTFASWDRTGKGRWFQVDHKKELQLEGADDVKTNMWLLNSATNTTSGRFINNNLTSLAARVGDHERAVSRQLGLPVRPHLRNATTVFKLRNIYQQAVPDGEYGNQSIKNNYSWEYSEITGGDHLKIASAAPKVETDALGDAKNVYLFPFSTGGVGRRFRNSENLLSGEDQWNTVKPWVITSKSFRTEETDVDSGNFGTLGLALINKKGMHDNKNTINLLRVPGARYAGYINNAALIRDIGELTLKGMSPIELESIGVAETGLFAHGRISPSIPIIGNANVQFEMGEGDIRVFKQFDFGELSVPAPFSVSNCSLTAFVSLNKGLGIDGRVDFGIERVGEGFLAAAVSTKGGFALAGEFNFDERLFGKGTKAKVSVGYADDKWSMGGSITIPQGKVPGIQTATINVNYSEADGFSASGDATLNVPGVESGTLAITQSEKEGFSIGGRFNLSADTPGIRGGSIEASVKEKPDGTGYAVSAKGEALPDIPGVNSKLTVSYNDGAFTAEINADYSRGMLSGKVNVGVTNRSVDENGQLSATAAEGNPLIVYGGGSLALQLAPWLRATAGVQFSPNGEITVTGEIGLPDELEIFRRYQVDKSIFNIAVQAPIFPGIVAEVGGGLSAQAGIGPGVIDKLRLGVTYNPDHEDQTKVTGDAHLKIPADAGLRLSVRAGIGLGITGASATGGLDIGGTLGIQGAAEAGVHVDWTPTQGLKIDANVGVHAQPSFTFDIGGYVSVRALGFSVYDNRWQFASYTFGSDYRFGIKLPIHYREGEPFDISLDDVEFEVPNISTSSLLRGLIDRIS